MAQEKTPGVYIVEENAFLNSVVEVPTGIPAFLGYTEVTKSGARDLAGVPMRINSLAEFTARFGGPAKTLFSRITGDGGGDRFESATQRFYLYHALRHFFDNGGGPCWIVSVGGFDAKTHTSADFSDDIWVALAKQDEPSICLCPDAVALERKDYVAISNRMLAECQTLANRVAILDVHDGCDGIATAIDGPDGFRSMLEFGDRPDYGVAYYPWVNTNLIDAGKVDFTDLDEDSLKTLADDILADLKTQRSDPLPEDWTDLVKRLCKQPTPTQPAATTHNALMTISPLYQRVMADLLAEINVRPPSGAMAGIYAQTDTEFGVFKAPANTSIISVTSPVIAISDEQQEDLNVPLNGLSVNAIREFPGRGTLVWGAHTLSGNSQDYRYIDVRRTMIMLEQSIKSAARAHAFDLNGPSTWADVKAMIESFPNNQWKVGALAGSSPEQAFDVDVGLGSTMTASDIENNLMNIAVRIALSRPAEFFVITLQQEMQSS